MAKRKNEMGLGKGLGALFGDAPILETETAANGSLPISQIEPNAAQPRTLFENEALDDLTASIQQHGVLQPILVRQLASGYYQIISGERRWRAAKKAGLSEIPAVIIEADDRKCLEIGLIENLQREDLNPMEEAKGYQALMVQFLLTQEEVSDRVGKSRPAVANALRLLNLTEKVQKLVTDGTLSAGHARTLLGLTDAALQEQAAEQVVKDGLSVRQTEALVHRLKNSKSVAPKKEDPNRIYYEQAEKDLGACLGRKVHIAHGRKKGTLQLEYYNMDDLNDLLEALQSLKQFRKETSE